MSEMTMSKEEFVQRFVTYMVDVAGPVFADGQSVAEYARESAPLYWDIPEQRAEGPEDCASSDLSEMDWVTGEPVA